MSPNPAPRPTPDPTRPAEVPGVPKPVMETFLPLPGRRRGKVRDIYHAARRDGTPIVLLVATDRISAFDVVMPTGIPGKGVVLTQISRFWFDMTEHRLGGAVAHHLLSIDPAEVRGLEPEHARELRGRVMLCRPTRVVPIECVVRGYLAGSGWRAYQESGRVCGVELPAGLRQCDRLPEPIFTPATKAQAGHDENIDFDAACAIAGEAVMHRLRELSLSLYRLGHDHAQSRGILLADTKFEFGLPVDAQGEVASSDPILIDEVLTPDSSRFWPAQGYQPGRDQPSYDKQFVRNYLEMLVAGGRWAKQPPGPELPRDIVTHTAAKYRQAYETLTGEPLALPA